MINNEEVDALKAILTKDINDLTGDDMAHLKARRSYLNADQLVKYAKVLDAKIEDEDEDEDPITRPEGLDEIVAKKAKDLTEEEVAFLKENAKALTAAEAKKFKEVLK